MSRRRCCSRLPSGCTIWQGPGGFGQFDLGFSFVQLQFLDLTKPAHPAMPISPSTGYAFSPAWSGNLYLYYVYSLALNGTYQVMRWDAIRRTTSAVMATASATSVSGVSVAPAEIGRAHV